MNNFKYAMQKSYDYMVEEINDILQGTIYSDSEKQRLFYACGTCLHWMLDYTERIEISVKDRKLIAAFRFANNMLKHDVSLFELTEQTGGIKFPMEFPLEIEEKEIKWKALEDNGKFESQYKNYTEQLQNKSVVETCKNALEILLQSSV